MPNRYRPQFLIMALLAWVTFVLWLVGAFDPIEVKSNIAFVLDVLSADSWGDIPK